MTSRPRASEALAPTGHRRTRRLSEAFVFVAVWIVLGYLLPVSAETYLLLGVPLTVLFQLLVRRRPLREVWVRDADTFVLGRRGVVVAAVLTLAPLYYGARELTSGSWALIGWYAAAVVGAVPAGFALGSSALSAVLRSCAPPLVIGVAGNVAIYGGLHVIGGVPVDLVAMLGTAVKSLALYVPLTFVIEEVSFRGALDAHIQHPGESHGWGTAVVGSVLWGLWHLPVSSRELPLPVLVLSLVSWHCVVGIPLAFAWRRSGNLAGPAVAHSAIDAVRNALLLGL